ncbi:MAG: hypothetical protein HY271_20460 [Deltaproteobacteria bacterium]|nr:hypothetical protein [Deltaproteobacteria bacterium]
MQRAQIGLQFPACVRGELKLVPNALKCGHEGVQRREVEAGLVHLR